MLIHHWKWAKSTTYGHELPFWSVLSFSSIISSSDMVKIQSFRPYLKKKFVLWNFHFKRIPGKKVIKS